MNLSTFIRGNHDRIIGEWQVFAGTLLPAAGGMSGVALRDHAAELLDAIALDLESPQDPGEQSEKSKGHGTEHRMEIVGTTHAALRIEDGFQLTQLVAEYRSLRASVLRLYEKQVGGAADLHQVTRFNEAIDEALVEATDRYMLVMKRTSDQFLAVLGHDLRNPLGAILTAAALMAASPGSEARNKSAAARILTSAERMSRMVNDLLDLTRTRLGSGIPIVPQPMDLAFLCRDVVAELEAFHPDGRLEVHCDGDLRGTWDADRLAQVLSNLVGNALQHGERGGVITVSAHAEDHEVAVEVHNTGRAIPAALLENIFEPMVRIAKANADGAKTSLGLGLHIAREIVLAHDGTLAVVSTEKQGTTFTMRLPRRSVAAASEPRVPAADRTDKHDAEGGIVAAKPAPEGR